MKFNKPPQTEEEHILLLEKRGMVIKDQSRFKKYHRTIGYYRLTGYMYPLQNRDGSHKFKNPTEFEFVLDHYLFDKKLRLILLNEIEKIEIAFRAAICNTYALNHGSHWYLESKHFNDATLHSLLLNSIAGYCNETSDLFIRSYKDKYTEPIEPAVWMIFEILTFGQLASLFENLKDTVEKKAVASQFGSVVSILHSWLKSINYIRNCCAHHGRLWNRKIPLKPIIPVRKEKRFLSIVDHETNLRVYGIISCMVFLINQINPKSNFKNRIKSLFEEFPKINKAHMGFHEKWLEENLWN